MRDFRTRYLGLQEKQKLRSQLPAGSPERRGDNRAAKNALTISTRARFAAVLSAEHLAVFDQFVQNQKKYMSTSEVQ